MAIMPQGPQGPRAVHFSKLALRFSVKLGFRHVGGRGLGFRGFGAQGLG